jgi:hypothetical protein
MPLTSDLVLDALTLDPSDPMARGRLEAIRRHHLPTGSEGSRGAHPLAAVIDDRLRRPLRTPGGPAYREPWRQAAVGFRTRRPGEAYEPLSAADVAFLQGVPSDPVKVSGDEAVRLAQLAQHTTGIDVPAGDRLLVERAFAPVRAHHEAMAKASELRAVAGQSDAPLVGESVLRAVAQRRADDVAGVLAQVVQAETPELTDTEARLRARQALSDRLLEQMSTAQQRLADARAELAVPEIAAASRTLDQLEASASLPAA